MNTSILPPHTKAVIFDFDGTLADTHTTHTKAWKQACTTFSIPFTEQTHRELSGHSSEKLACILLDRCKQPKTLAHRLVSLKNDYYTRMLHEIKYFPQTYNLLIAIHNQIPLALGTNEDHIVFEKVKQYGNLQNYFSVIVALDKTLAPKPAPDIFLQCAKELQVAPHHCHVIEDSIRGIQAAENAGMTYTDVSYL